MFSVFHCANDEGQVLIKNDSVIFSKTGWLLSTCYKKQTTTVSVTFIPLVRIILPDISLLSNAGYNLSNNPVILFFTLYTGIILYEIYSRKAPYEGENPRSILRRVCDPRINYRPTLPSTMPKRISDIMQKCWSSDPLFRPDAKDLDMIFGEMTTNDTEPLVETSANNRMRTEVATGDMLYKVFPKAVADKLKAGQKVEP